MGASWEQRLGGQQLWYRHLRGLWGRWESPSGERRQNPGLSVCTTCDLDLCTRPLWRFQGWHQFFIPPWGHVLDHGTTVLPLSSPSSTTWPTLASGILAHTRSDNSRILHPHQSLEIIEIIYWTTYQEFCSCFNPHKTVQWESLV